MSNSLGDYTIEQSSSSNINNIKWTQKNPHDAKKSKKKTSRKISPTNIIYAQKIENVKPPVEKVFKVEEMIDTKKPKKKKTDKIFQNASASNCKIKHGFRKHLK